MSSSKFYLDRRYKAKDGKGSIILVISHNHTTSSISTGIRIFPSEWDGNRIKRDSPSFALNARLIELKARVDKDIALLSLNDEYFTMSAADIKVNVSTSRPVRNKGHLISDVFDEYTSNSMKDGTREIYKATLKKILIFGGESITLEAINLKWLYGFEKYLSATQTPNGRAIYFRCLRAVCNYAKHIGITSSYPFENFKFKTEPTRKRSVNVELFRKFLNFPVDEVKGKYRDYFVISFLLIGINIKDLLLSRHNQVIDGRLEYIRNKTHKKYSIKIEPEAQALLDKYAGNDYLLEAMDHCKHHKSFARAINEACQMIGPEIEVQDELFPDKTEKRIEPIIQGITTYFARHSWATFAYEIGIPIDVISQALGHSINNRTTMIYIKYDQSKQDEANRRVIDYVFSNSGSSLFSKNSQAASPG